MIAGDVERGARRELIQTHLNPQLSGTGAGPAPGRRAIPASERWRRADHVACASDRGRILFFKRTGGNLGYFGHERSCVKVGAQQFLF